METYKNKKAHLGTLSKSVPFYELPPRKTSAEIINEAKAAIQETGFPDTSPTTIKPLYTERPFTPKEKGRIFFGKTGKTNRPPSSFSLRYLQEQSDLHIPSTLVESNAEIQLDSNENIQSHSFSHIPDKISSCNEHDGRIFNLNVKEINLQKIKLPSLDTINLPQKPKKPYKTSFSLDSYSNENRASTAAGLDTRNAFSSPQESTDFSRINDKSLFGKLSRHSSVSECLILEPQNLDKLFGNKQIVENSETLFEKTDKLEAEGNLTIEEVIEMLNNKMLNNETHKAENNETVIRLLKMLYKSIEKEQKLHNKINSTTKIHILKCLYKFVETENEELLIHIARIILALKVTGNNLSGVCKLIFKVSKNDKNDHLFLEENILVLFLDALGRSSPLDDAEACVYGYGAVKFLTTNSKLLDSVLNLGILPLMVLHLKIINNAKVEKLQLPEQTNHVMFQLTGALRNLASSDENYENFICTGAVNQLCLSLKLFLPDFDVISNIARNLSHLSSNDNCCDNIAECEHLFETAIEIFEKYAGNEEIIVRIAYTLGNTVARSDAARTKLYEASNSIKSMIRLWRLYLDLTLKHCSMMSDSNEEGNSSTEDVMVKLIRIIANLSINTTIGKELNKKYGTQLIDEFLKVLISNPFKKNDELVLSVLSTLNNLSYYYITELEKDVFHMKQIDIMEAIDEYISCKNRECNIEAIRILGNLSRSKMTRNYITKNAIIDVLFKYLDEDDLILLKTTIGVFVNLMADNQSKEVFRKKEGVAKLATILNSYSQYDWNLGMLICQTIWNYCIDATNLYELISNSEIEQLMEILANLLDEEKIFGIKDITRTAICSTEEFIAWEEFAYVGTNLLEKIEHFLEVMDTDEVKVTGKNGKTKKDSCTSIVDVRDSSTNLSFAAC